MRDTWLYGLALLVRPTSYSYRNILSDMRRCFIFCGTGWGNPELVEGHLIGRGIL
jgi:hypothetical protein